MFLHRGAAARLDHGAAFAGEPGQATAAQTLDERVGVMRKQALLALGHGGLDGSGRRALRLFDVVRAQRIAGHHHLVQERNRSFFRVVHAGHVYLHRSGQSALRRYASRDRP